MTTPTAYLVAGVLLAILVALGLMAATPPQPRMDAQWDKMQTCLYARSPETLEAIGSPAMPCSRNDIPGFSQGV